MTRQWTMKEIATAHLKASDDELDAAGGNLEPAGLYARFCHELDALPASEEPEDGLQKLLDSYIRKAFDHERVFIERFWGGKKTDELRECYMASYRTRISMLTSSGATVTTTILTDEFMAWCDQQEVAE